MADSPSSCLSVEALEGMAAGRTTAAGARDHIVVCPACALRLERIQEDNRFLRGFTVDGGLPRPPADDPAELPAVPGYDVIREVHRGGQGVVYQAVQRSTKRSVAIKVMKQGPFATLADRARFEREIEILAKLEHPHIVAVHDAGVFAGFHYFVMDYMEGKPLDEAILDFGLWSAESGGNAGELPKFQNPKSKIGAVVSVFVKVCDAVHAAHLRGIIHRDLKPSNIFVDAAGEPKVLDFGLAKLSQDGSEIRNPKSEIQNPTMTGQFVGSLPWASPEQVEGLSSKIDLRTDVYSLGTILFQLLTGVLPFDPGSNLRQALDEILTREPRRPSAVLAGFQSHPSRRFVASWLRGSVPSPINDELDTIVLKCLSKDRERRYQSAGDLARDLRSYQAGEPIEAKRDSAWYVLRKAAWRKRRVLLALSVPALLLPVAAAAMYRSAEVARQVAHERGLREVEELRNAAMLEITRRLQARPGSASDSPGGQLSKLNAGAIQTDLDTGSLSVSDHGVALLLAEALRDRGSDEEIVKAEGLVRQAMNMFIRKHGSKHAEIGRMRTILADMLLRRGSRMPEAEQAAELAVTELTAAFGSSSPETARGRIMLARIKLARGNASGAIDAAREALAGDHVPDSILRIEAQATIAAIHAERGEQEEARRNYLEALRVMLHRTHDTDSKLLDLLELGATMVEHGVVPAETLYDPGCLREALAGMHPACALREVAIMLRGGADGTIRDGHYLPARFVMIGLRERLLGPEDPTLGASLASAAASLFGAVFRADGYNAPLIAETEALFRRAIPLQIMAHGPDSPLVGRSYESLGTCLIVACRLREATEWFARDCELWMRQPPELGDEYQVLLRARWTAWHATRACAYELGLDWTSRALDLVNKTMGPDHAAAALMHACRAVCLASLQRKAESLECETMALRIIATQPVPEDQRNECHRFVGLARLLSNRMDEARAIIEPAWQIGQSKSEAPGVLEWTRTMLTYCRAIGDPARAESFERYIRDHGRGDIVIVDSGRDAR